MTTLQSRSSNQILNGRPPSYANTYETQDENNTNIYESSNLDCPSVLNHQKMHQRQDDRSAREGEMPLQKGLTPPQVLSSGASDGTRAEECDDEE